MIVTATDGGGLASDAHLVVHVTDVNDNRPQFDCSNKKDQHLYSPEEVCFYSIEVQSDSPINYTVMNLLAVDADDITRMFLHYLT